MIRCTEENRKEILDYIGKDYGQCLYLYVDLLKYGFKNPNIRVWWQKNDNEIKVLVLQYYTGVHVFSKNKEFDEADVVTVLKEINPSMICGMEQTLKKISHFFEDYKMEIGLVGQLMCYKDLGNQECYKADESEIHELAQLLSEDEALGGPYGFELLYAQLLERKKENFGRNYIYRVDGEIVATASTYAEQGGVAVISGVLVRPDFRGKGLSKRVLSAVCKELLEDGFDVFSYYYIESAKRMHSSVGFETIGNWAKLVKQ